MKRRILLIVCFIILCLSMPSAVNAEKKGDEVHVGDEFYISGKYDNSAQYDVKVTTKDKAVYAGISTNLVYFEYVDVYEEDIFTSDDKGKIFFHFYAKKSGIAKIELTVRSGKKKAKKVIKIKIKKKNDVDDTSHMTNEKGKSSVYLQGKNTEYGFKYGENCNDLNICSLQYVDKNKIKIKLSRKIKKSDLKYSKQHDLVEFPYFQFMFTDKKGNAYLYYCVATKGKKTVTAYPVYKLYKEAGMVGEYFERTLQKSKVYYYIKTIDSKGKLTTQKYKLE